MTTEKRSLMKEALPLIKTLKGFVNPQQLDVWASGLREEEREFFFEKLEEYATRIDGMPKTYETDGQGDDAIVYLHYFCGHMDFYITEKDMYDEQHQAFGYTVADFSELGYISIEELKKVGAELDIHWTPKKLGIVKAARG